MFGKADNGSGWSDVYVSVNWKVPVQSSALDSFRRSIYSREQDVPHKNASLVSVARQAVGVPARLEAPARQAVGVPARLEAPARQAVAAVGARVGDTQAGAPNSKHQESHLQNDITKSRSNQDYFAARAAIAETARRYSPGTLVMLPDFEIA